MKSIKVFIILTLTFFINTSYAGVIYKTYYFSNYNITYDSKGYCLINFDNTVITGVEGEPILPYQAISLLLPPGQIAEKVEFVGNNEFFIAGEYTIAPKQAVRRYSDNRPGSFIINEDVYTSNTVYPSKPLGNYTTQFLNGHSVVLATFTPVRYIPKTKTISYYQKVVIKITTREGEKAQQALKNLSENQSTVSQLKTLIQNPKMLDRYSNIINRSVDDNEQYEMLIITSNQYSNSFGDLINLYIPRGIIAKVATTEDINNNMTGQDLQEKIRNYIIQEHQNHSIEFVLLGGDVEIVPARGFYCTVSSGGEIIDDNNIPANLYYSALDGTWNDDGDSHWGEPGEDDLLPDVSVGRLPFSSTNELNNMIHKITMYQDNPILGELNKPLLVGEFACPDPLTYGANYLELLVGEHDAYGYSTTGIPETDPYDSLYDRTSQWYSYQFVEKVNNGRPAIYHVGHSNVDYMLKLVDYEITNSKFYALNGTTHNYPFVYSHGCLCGAFDENDCIAEKMISIANFAVSGVFNSRYGWFNEGTADGPSQHLNREFVNALYANRKSRLGETQKLSKIATSPWVTAPGQWEEGALRWCFYDCNVLGDPALSLWTDEPISIDVTFETSISIDDPTMSVTVTNNGVNVEGLTCVLLQDNIICGKAVTDENGNAVIQFNNQVTYGNAQLVVSGYNCLPHYYDITITDIDEKNIVSRLDIYPNPVSNQFTVVYTGNDKLSEIKISNIFGATIKTLVAESNIQAVDVNNLADGIYIVTVFVNGVQVENKKIIKK